MSEANIDQNRDNVKHTGHVSATRALREPRYSIIDLQKAYAEGRAEAIAQEQERIEKALEAAWTTHGAISQAVVLRIIRDTGATTGEES